MGDRARGQGQYWEENVLSWEKGAYSDSAPGTGRARLLDRLSTFFRGRYVQDRMAAAAALLAPHLPGLTVLDVGCASGRFALQLLELGAGRVIGIDVATSAVEAANRRVNGANVGRLEFLRADVTASELRLPSVDLVTALGVLEYLDRASLSTFLGKLDTEYCLFDLLLVEEVRTLRLLWPLRKLYLRAKRCPGVYLHTLPEIVELAERSGFSGMRRVECRGFHFATNLPGGQS